MQLGLQTSAVVLPSTGRRPRAVQLLSLLQITILLLLVLAEVLM